MVTEQQIRRLYKLSKTEKTEEIAAAKAGMDVKTARKYLRATTAERDESGTALADSQGLLRRDLAGDTRTVEDQSGAGGKDDFRAAATEAPGAVCRWPTPDAAAEGEALA